MLDDLRNSSTFEEEEPQPAAETSAPSRLPRRSKGPFLGMTPLQRFFLALILFMMVCVAGVGLLLISGAIVPF
jgi:hypothetical protein